MSRPRTNAKRTVVGIREGLIGWVEFRGRTHEGGSMAAYLNDLAAEDREAVLAEGGQQVEKYRAYLTAMGYDAELEALQAEGRL